MLTLLSVAFVGSAEQRFLEAKADMSPDVAKYALSTLDYSQITALETTTKGRLWASVLCGGDSADGFLTLAYSDTQGKEWVEPALAIDARDRGYAVRNGQLWLSPKGELWLFYSVFDGYYDGRGSMWAVVSKNPDDEKPLWSEPSYLGVGIPTGRPAVGKGGEIILPVALWGREVISYDKALFIANKWRTPRFASPYADSYSALDEKRGAGIYISHDGGASWQEHLGVVKCEGESVKARYNNPQLFLDSGGSLRMVLRASGTAWSFSSRSFDGKTWSAPTRFVSAPDQNFAVKRLADGRLLMVRNGRFDRYLHWLPEGLYAYLSDDCGESWYGGLRLASDNVTINPVVAESKDGTIYIAVHHDPEFKCENRLVTTSVAEIDAATADYNNAPTKCATTLTAKGAAAVAEAKMKLWSAPKSDWSTEKLRLATYNIQYPVQGWPTKRLAPLVALLKEYKFDIFGAQEPYLHQIEDMMRHIGDEYSWVGSNVTGDDSDRKHHFNPIFYRRDRLELLDHNTVWLSEAIGKAGFGARSSRIFTWAKFRDKRTDKVFFMFNGHYDHRGAEAKIVASYVVLDLVQRISQGMPTFITADYNADEESDAYAVLKQSPLVKDAMLMTENTVNRKYQSLTFYEPAYNREANGRHIDHIFCTPNSVRIVEWNMIIKDYNGLYGSDHLPIFVDCYIAN